MISKLAGSKAFAHATDGVTVPMAITAPIWAEWFEVILADLMMIGGFALLVLRLMLAWREWRGRQQESKQGKTQSERSE